MEAPKQTAAKRYLYGKADEKYVKAVVEKTIKKTATSSYKFRANALLLGKTDRKEFNKADVPILFKCTPDTLLNLCSKVLDEMPLPQVYKWSIEDVCKWLRATGYKQYQNTFRVNLITGPKLLLLDAAALAAINIKDFAHIKVLAKAIRDLFYYEMITFGRCLSLYPEYHQELYKLVRLKTGDKYIVRRCELWRKMQLIRQKQPNHTHWEILDRWLGCKTQPHFKELFGAVRRSNLYACRAAKPKDPVPVICSYCACVPPCECFSSEANYRRPWHLKCLPHLRPDQEFVAECGSCTPPCNCRWPSKSYQIQSVLSSLKEILPYKYDCNFGLLRVHNSNQICFAFFPKL